MRDFVAVMGNSRCDYHGQVVSDPVVGTYGGLHIGAMTMGIGDCENAIITAVIELEGFLRIAATIA